LHIYFFKGYILRLFSKQKIFLCNFDVLFFLALLGSA